MQEKVELILNELIRNYLKVKEPISSTSLKKLAQLNMSPSTIRGYFQMLEKMGMIEKEHIASGSYPSIKAMELFWQDMLPKRLESFSLDSFEKNCEKFDIAAFIKIFENQMLNEVYKLDDRFIILEFEYDETVIKYDENIYNLLKSLKFINSKELIKILKRYNLNNLLKKIENFQKSYAINQNLLYNKFSKVNFEFFNQIDELYINYDKKLLIKRYSLNDEYKEIDIYLIGDVYSDFLGFLESIKGGDNGKKEKA